MPNAGATVQPVEVPQLRCPRCWFSAPMVPVSALNFRCSRCEWTFTLSAPSLAAAPAFPATTVAVANPYATPVAAAISANGATITNVSVSGATAGTAAGTYVIPVGGTISCTYTVATPTWTWALPVTSASASAGGTSLTFAPTGTNTPFAIGQVLIVDPSGTSDVVTVNGAPTSTSVPVNSLNSAHNSGVSVTVASLAPYLSSVEAVPQTAY
jgi:hypothetical protein